MTVSCRELRWMHPKAPRVIRASGPLKIFSSKRSPPAPSGNQTTSICTPGKNRSGVSLKNSRPTFLGHGDSVGPPATFIARPSASVESPGASAASALPTSCKKSCIKGLERSSTRANWLKRSSKKTLTSALNHHKAQHREVRRLDQLAVRQQFALDFVELVVGQADRWEHGPAIGIAILPDHHIAAAQILEVVGERAERADDRVRIPPGLVLDALALDRALAQQVVEVDGEFAAARFHFCVPGNA